MNNLLRSIEPVREALKQPLPGQIAQKMMAPQHPRLEKERWVIPDDCREAAVLILFYLRPNVQPTSSADSELYLALMRRPEYQGAHSGQISFPGGRREPGETLLETALRETQEEIGVGSNHLDVLGPLSPMFIPPSNFCIYPFVAYSRTLPVFQPDAIEVAEVIETPLSLLMDRSIRQVGLWDFPDDEKRHIPFFDVFGHHVWGATAMVLSELLHLLGYSVET